MKAAAAFGRGAPVPDSEPGADAPWKLGASGGLPAGEVAWFYKQDPTVFAAIQGVMVVDGMDPQYLHVQEISPDSTWQPVIPTP